MRVTDTIGPAWERMKVVLFRPFNLGAWFSFGFIFALQACVEGGGGGNFNVPSGNGGGGGSGGGHHGGGGSGSDDTSNSIGHFVTDALGSMSGAMHGHGAASGPSGAPNPFEGADMSLVGPLILAGIVIAIPLFLAMYWLGARGQMMAIRAVATGRADIGESWAATKGPGGAFFMFHLVVLGLSALVFLPLLGGGGVYLYSVYKQNTEDFAALLPGAIVLMLALFVVAIPFMILNGLARNFVAPLMMKDGTGSREAWAKFWSVGKNFIGQLVLFFVLRVVFSMVAGVVGVIAGFVTCCLGFLPVLHQTVMAPYYVFERAWTLEILASMGPEFDVRQSAGPPQGPMGYGPPPGFGGPGYSPGANPYAPPGYGSPPPGGFGGGGQGY